MYLLIDEYKSTKIIAIFNLYLASFLVGIFSCELINKYTFKDQSCHSSEDTQINPKSVALFSAKAHVAGSLLRSCLQIP